MMYFVSGIRVNRAHHGHGVQLPQRFHSLEHDDYKSTTLYGLYRSCKEIGGDGLEVLQYAHAECLAENFVRLFVVAACRNFQ